MNPEGTVNEAHRIALQLAVQYANSPNVRVGGDRVLDIAASFETYLRAGSNS